MGCSLTSGCAGTMTPALPKFRRRVTTIRSRPTRRRSWGWRSGVRDELVRHCRTRALVLAALVATGAVRVLKNLPEVSFAPMPTMLVDWTHLGLAFVLGGIALARPLLRAVYIRKASRR